MANKYFKAHEAYDLNPHRYDVLCYVLKLNLSGTGALGRTHITFLILTNSNFSPSDSGSTIFRISKKPIAL